MPNNAQPQQPTQSKPGFENEGEGNKTAARHYNEATQQYVKSGKVEHAAKEAEQALESDEGEELREAEEEAKATKPEPPRH